MAFPEITATDALGYAAAILVLLAFSLRSIAALRLAAIVSNVLFIAYAIASSSMPILVLHTTLLPLNIWRLIEMRSGQSLSAGNRRPPLKNCSTHHRRNRTPSLRASRARPSIPHH